MSNRTLPPLRAVFLDIGDTVMRPNPSWEHVYAIAFAEQGIEVDIADLDRALRAAYHHGGWGLGEPFEPSEAESFRRSAAIDQAAIAELGIGPMPDEFFRRLHELFMLTSHWHVFPDAYELLPALRERGITIGAVSNWVWDLPELLHALDLVRYFDFIVASARVGFEKPHRGIFEYALERAGVAPDEAIHVGDHVDADVAGATALGIGAVLIDRRERHLETPLPAGVTRITSLAELLPLIDARGAAA
ncbi:MAG: HAD-IA family hydrolase [Chloroflexota bacterium]